LLHVVFSQVDHMGMVMGMGVVQCPIIYLHFPDLAWKCHLLCQHTTHMLHDAESEAEAMEARIESNRISASWSVEETFDG